MYQNLETKRRMDSYEKERVADDAQDRRDSVEREGDDFSSA